MAPLKSMSVAMLAGLASLTAARRTDVKQHQGMLSQEGLGGGCRVMVKAISVCVRPGDGRFFLENLAGHAAEDLNCMSTWCAAKKDACCATVEELKSQLEGQTASSTHLDQAVFDKLQTAASMPAGAVPDVAPGAADQKVSAPRKAVAPVPVAKPSEPVELEAAAPVEGSTNATGGADIDPTKCMCPIGTRSVNLAGYGPYEKTNWQIKGPDGGKCTGSCDTCTRTLAGDRLPCCERTIDGKLGKCGKETKAPQFNGKQCICGGTTVQKEQLYMKNPACLPETKCSACRHDCI